MHKLLLRQRKRHVRGDVPTRDEWDAFLDAVDEAYQQSDADRDLVARSLDLTSTELLEKNRALRLDNAERRRVEEQLRGRTARLLLLHTIATGIASSRSLEQIVGRAVEQISAYFGRGFVAFATIDPRGILGIVHKASVGEVVLCQKQAVDLTPFPDYLATLRGGESYVVADTALDPPAAAVAVAICGMAGARAMFDAPVRREGRLESVLILRRAEPGAWSADDAATIREAADFLAVMIGHKQLENRLALTDRLASVGTLAAGIGHEINNPLASLIANLTLLAEADERRGGAPGGDLDALGEARQAAERIRVIVRDLLSFARPPEEDGVRVIDVHRCIEAAVGLARSETAHRAVVVRDFGDVPLVRASEARLAQVLLNLLVNAAQSIEEGQAERHAIRISTRTNARGDAVVTISDTGCGIPEEHLGRIFDPFFTTKPVGVGTGMGLSICHSIVQGFGGSIEVESEVGVGSAFRVVIPAASAAPRAAQPPAPVTRSVARGQVLVIDDEPLIIRAIKRSLSSEHDVTGASSGAEGLAVLQAGRRFDVIFCDLMMPELTGMDVHQRIAEIAPEQLARVVILTGGAFTPRARAFLADATLTVVGKPFDIEALRALVRDVIASSGPLPTKGPPPGETGGG